MRKTAIKKKTNRTTTTTVGRNPKFKDASTQTYRYVEYMPLPIIVDIKSEDESDAEPFNDDIPYHNDDYDENEMETPIMETLKIEIHEVHQPKQINENHPPMIEEFLLPGGTEQTIEPLLPPALPSPSIEMKPPAPVTGKESKKRTKSQQSRKSSDDPSKPKRAKRINNDNRSKADQPNKGGRPRKCENKPEFVECSLCSFTCKRPSHLARHFLMHTGERPHKCEHCPKSFAQKTDLNRHMAIHAALYPTHCDSCGRGFPDDDTLQKHQQRCQTKRYICDICQYQTFSIGNLDLHKRKHTNERPFACPSCDKRFTRVAHLNQHVKLHANDFEMHCNMCGRGFSEEKELLRHELTCKNRMFQCHMCRDTHIRMDNLRRHIKIIHMGEKEVMCEYCSKQFPAKSSLTKHIKFKHPERAQ